MSDYHPAHVQSHLEEIREQLGILEATLVPDSDVDTSSVAAAESASEKLSTIDGEVDTKPLEALSMSSAGRSTSADGNPSKINFASGKVTQMSRSISASGSRSSGKSTSPTSVVDDEEGYAGELDLLKSLFPAL